MPTAQQAAATATWPSLPEHDVRFESLQRLCQSSINRGTCLNALLSESGAPSHSCFLRKQRDAVFPPPPPPPSDEHPSWTDESWASPLDVTRRIFCNRSLNMRTISAIGFDMVGVCCCCA